MTPGEDSPSAGWRETADAMHVDPDPEFIEETAEDLREYGGFDDVAEWLEERAEELKAEVENGVA